MMFCRFLPVLMAQAAIEASLDADRLSFTAELFHLTEMIDLAVTLEEEAIEPLSRRLRRRMLQEVLPPCRLRINHREVKQVYNKHKPKKPDVSPPRSFALDEQFLDFVQLLDPLAPVLREDALK